MTKSRKIGISVAVMLIFVLACATFIPLCGVNNVNIADAAAPVITDTAATWENKYSGTYYDNLNTDLTGAAFRTQLAKLIGPTSGGGTHHTNTVYNGSSSLALNNVWPKSDVDPQNPNSGQLKWFYTGTLVSSNNFGGSVGQTNREHVWAKNGGDTFTAEAGPGADAHHLRPTECQLNSTRGNLGFAVVTQSSSTAVRQNNSTSYGTGDGLCYKSGSFFYPAKGYRGQTARILMYMQVRYGDEFNLYFVDGASSSNGKGIGKISDLFMWHLLEPPTEDEIYRNNIIAGIQGNRNPFIDHPEYAEMIYCNGYDTGYSNKLANLVEQYGSYLDNDNEKEAPTSITLSANSLNLTVGAQSSKITVTPTPSNASNRVTWTTSDKNVATVTNGVVTAVSEGTATITATSTRDSNVAASLTVTVTRPALQSLSISPSALNLTLGGTRQLTVTATPSGANNSVNWSSSNDGVVSVSQTGFVTAVSEGTATVTATSKDNPAISASVTVNVLSQVENSQLFVDSLAEIDSAKTLKERFEAIQQAIIAYNQMTVSEKTNNASGYAKLQEAILKYNEDVGKINDDCAMATDLAAQTMSYRVSSAFMALVTLVVQGLFGR